MSGESRTELIGWINQTLGLAYSKVEQCGTGAAYAQIMDSIYGDVQMAKLKFNARQEYEILDNYKVLQTTFTRHKITKPLDVIKLSKCKMMENLEFLQWLKRHWDQNFPGGDYDAESRRSGQASYKTATPSQQTYVQPQRPASTNRNAAPTTARRVIGATPVMGGSSTILVKELKAQIENMNIDMEAMEKERVFYYEKLRDIELLVQAYLSEETEESSRPENAKVMECMTQIEAILYKVEDGFEVPEEEVNHENLAIGSLKVDDEETF